VISGLIAGSRLARELLANLWWWSHLAWLGIKARLVQNWRSGVIRKIVCGVCAEAAVLALIFPFLDVVVANNEILTSAKSGNVAQLISVRSVLVWSLSFVALALFGAFILGAKEDGE
jgi:hypothetical protein